MSSELKLAKQTAISASNLLKSNYLDKVGILDTTFKDIKTDADFAAHNHIIEKLNITGIKIYSEESNDDYFNINDQQWIIDPLDGTMNFSRGFPMAAISISLWNNGKPVLGVIHDIFSNNTYYANQNGGAYLNEKKIFVSKEQKENNAIIATGFPSGSRFTEDYLNDLVRHIKKYKKVRMLGSASLMLAFVANGFFDIYKENDIYIWDVASGLIIVDEAGGDYNFTPGSSSNMFNVKATNSLLRT